MPFLLVTWSMKESLIKSALQFPVLSWQMARDSWRGEKKMKRIWSAWVCGRFVLRTQPSVWRLCHTVKQHSLICTVSKDIIVFVVMFLKRIQERKEGVWCEAHLFIYFFCQFWGVTLQAILFELHPLAALSQDGVVGGGRVGADSHTVLNLKWWTCGPQPADLHCFKELTLWNCMSQLVPVPRCEIINLSIR